MEHKKYFIVFILSILLVSCGKTENVSQESNIQKETKQEVVENIENSPVEENTNHVSDNEIVETKEEALNDNQELIYISNHISEGKSVYQKDGNNVYYNGNIIPSIDVKTFDIIYCDQRGYDCYSKDKNNIYYSLENDIFSLDGADVSSFHILGDGTDFYAKDKNNVYLKGKKIGGADVITFILVGPFVAKDKNNVFLGDEIAKNVDVNTFEKITNSHYFKDKNNKYEIIYGELTIVN